MPAIGVLTLELHILGARSLKDKRSVVKGLKDRLRTRHNVAVSEIDYQDVWQRSLVSVVTVSPSRGHAEAILQSVENDAASILGAMLVSTTLEWVD
jgi:uncharacterized protein YlxP (DUF503 family)